MPGYGIKYRCASGRIFLLPSKQIFRFKTTFKQTKPDINEIITAQKKIARQKAGNLCIYLFIVNVSRNLLS